MFEHKYISSVDLNSYNNTTKILADAQYEADSLWDLYPSLADGDYEIETVNNTAGNVLYVRPRSFTAVYDSTSGDITSNPIMLTSAVTAYMKIRKVGNKLFYLQRNGFHA